ncbi:LBF_2127 family putative lipoprotein [Leptospira harrisiae]|uniref:Lipoprotein n=1 Tax=Leptospira harrisiae TaxID=2023189 RepID=A0A2N0ANW6_9LEPT|nr:hypothetical protein [Leptospira harrisiae]PJZ85989.1 hypothetical protein CH364_07365 [Leptospira harrisiae]PKA09551.1 hypothetical protein CH366_07640 [Leptospira harrisiae]
MRSKVLFLFLSFSFLSCQVDIRQIPPIKQDSELLISKYPNQLFIGKFDIITYDRILFVNRWKSVFIDHLKSTRLFSKVSAPNDTTKITSDDFILDVTIHPKYSDTYNYWWTWPAIYPLVGYWPIQIRETNYKVQIDYNLYKGTQIYASNTLVEEAELTVEIYGFYRTANIEKMIETSNLLVVEKCFKDIESKLQSSNR